MQKIDDLASLFALWAYAIVGCAPLLPTNILNARPRLLVAQQAEAQPQTQAAAAANIAALLAHVDLVAVAKLAIGYALTFLPLVIGAQRLASVGVLIAPIVEFAAALAFIRCFGANFVYALSCGFFCGGSESRLLALWRSRRRVVPRASIEAAPPLDVQSPIAIVNNERGGADTQQPTTPTAIAAVERPPTDERQQKSLSSPSPLPLRAV